MDDLLFNQNKIRCLLNIIIFKLALMDFGMEGKSTISLVWLKKKIAEPKCHDNLDLPKS